MITKYKFKNFYYNSFNHISKNKIYELFFDKENKYNIDDYFKKVYNSKAEFFFFKCKIFTIFFLKTIKIKILKEYW